MENFTGGTYWAIPSTSTNPRREFVYPTRCSYASSGMTGCGWSPVGRKSIVLGCLWFRLSSRGALAPPLPPDARAPSWTRAAAVLVVGHAVRHASLDQRQIGNDSLKLHLREPGRRGQPQEPDLVPERGILSG